MNTPEEKNSFINFLQHDMNHASQVESLGNYKKIYDHLYDLALSSKKSINTIDYYDFLQSSSIPANLMQEVQCYGKDFFDQLVDYAKFLLQKKVDSGTTIIRGKKIVHTAPHHDDILLGYYTYAVKQCALNENYIVYLTDGYHGVSDHCITDLIDDMVTFDNFWFDQLFSIFYQNAIDQFVQSFHQNDKIGLQQARYKIFGSLVIQEFKISHVEQLKMQLWNIKKSLEDQEFCEKYQLYDACNRLKGMIRRSESDCKWAIVHNNNNVIHHFNALFYNEALESNFLDDARRLAEYFKKIQPDIITVALDLCGVGPVTHFMGLQLVVEALQMAECYHVEIIGYRNVWSQFSIAQADYIVPISSDDINVIKTVYDSCFITQKDPLYPLPWYQGPFSDVVEQIYDHQLQDFKIISQEFYNLSQDVVGCVYLKKLTLAEAIRLIK